MKLKLLAAVAGIMIICGSRLLAQTEPNLEAGFKPYGSYHGTGIDTVDLMNGNVTLHISFPANYPQRGALHNDMMLMLHSKGWQLNPSSGTTNTFWAPVRADMGSLIDVPTHERTLTQATVSGQTFQAVSKDAIVTWDGASHRLMDVSNGAQTAFEATDGSGWHVSAANPNQYGVPQTAIITDRAGTQYAVAKYGTIGDPLCQPSVGGGFSAPGGHPPLQTPSTGLPGVSSFHCLTSGQVTAATDSNGNTVSLPLTGAWTDTVGRSTGSAPPTFYFGGFNGLVNASANPPGCVGAYSFYGSSTISYPAVNGSTNQILVCYANFNIQTTFGVAGATEYPNATAGGSGAATLISGIVLPDGSSWSFNYDSYGNLTYVGLPLGGSISYQWATVAFPSSNSTPVSRAVTQRTITDNGGNSYVWKYQWVTSQNNPTSPNGTYTDIVTDPLNNDTVHVFTTFSGTLAFYETTTSVYQGSSSSGVLLKQVVTGYQTSSVTNGKGDDAITVLPNSIQTTVYPSGKVSLIQKTYDTALTDPTSGSTSYGKVVAEKVYDWGQGAPGPLLRETDTTYKWQVNSSYLTAHFLDLPATVIVKDGAGCAVSETDYDYDEPAYLTSSTISIQHSAPPSSVRGNLTSLTRWLAAASSCNPKSGTAVVSHTNWYDTGEVYRQIDALGHITTHSYDPAYVGAYSTQTCNALSQCVSGTYDFTTGLLASFTNANATSPATGNTPGDSGHTTLYSYDLMSRLTSAVFPPDPGGNHAQTTFDFPNVTTVHQLRTITSSLNDNSTTHVDGLGRAIRTEHATPAGTTLVDLSYDGLGHVTNASNPYFSTNDLTYGITTNQYDGLDRVTQTTTQDGSISRVKYSVATTAAANGDCNISTDEAGKQRGTCTDALGRLVEIDEPNPGATVSVNYHATMQQDGNFVLFNSANNSLWSTGTGGSNAGPIMMQDDGNLVLYTFKWQAGVYAAPTPGSYPAQSCGSKAYLNTGDRLNSGQCIVSPHGQYILYMAPDGNFFIYDIAHGAATWGANTYGHPGAYAVMQSDGNFCIYAADNTFLWMSGTNGTGAERLDMEDDGRIIIYKSVWNSQTATGQFNWTQLAHPSCDVGTGTGWTGVLGSGQCFVSPNGHFELLLQADGNLVLNDLGANPARMLWSTDTAVSPADPGFALRTLYTYDALGNLKCVEQHGDATTGTGCSADPGNDATSPWRVRRFTYDSLSRLLTAKNPESGTISYVYDNDGNLLQKTSPTPNQTGSATQTVSYCYDELHRVTGKAYGAQSCPLSSAVVSYSYDSGANAKGKLTHMADQAGTADYTYDVLGRLTTETRSLTGANNASVWKTVSYDYNLDGSLKALHYPSGATVTYAPWNNGSVALSTPQEARDSGNNINYVTGAAYGPDLSLTGFVSGSGGPAAITSSFSYNKRLQPVTMSASTPSQTVFSIGYEFHAGNGTPRSGSDNGDVFGIYNYRDRSRDQSFSYDALNRLTSAQNAGTNCAVTTLNGKTEYWGNSFGYDAWGNLLNKTVTKCSAENAVFTMNGRNQALYYSYDAAGNMLSDGIFSYTFDQENRITGANGYTYIYDGDGNRVRKSNGNLAANGTLYWYMSPGVVAESDLAGTLKSEYVFFDGERVARKDFPGNTVAYYFSDHLKTASVITDASGTIKAESDYYPWGGELQFVNNDSNDYKFTGKKRDSETGLDYFGARYYSNGLGRFITPDWSMHPEPVPYADPVDPQTLNQYSYVRNLPTTRMDADGHDAGTAAAVWELLAGGAEGAGVSGGFWAVGSVALPGVLGGGLAHIAINSTAQNNYTVANAEMQYQVALNNLAITINAMARAGKSTEQLRREWEKLTGQKWPKDPATGANQDAHHVKPKADAGADTAENIQPMPHGDHVDHHKKNGDFKRWGKRAHEPKPEPPKPEPPKPEPPKPEPPKPEPPKTEPQK